MILKEIRSYKLKIEGDINPLQPNTIKYPYKKVNPFYLTAFLFRLNKKNGFELKTYYKKCQHDAKYLLYEYNPDQIINTMIRCCEIARNPFSFKFVEQILSEDK